MQKYIVIPEPQHAITVGLDPARARSIPCSPLDVLAAIGFDDQSCLDTREIRDEAGDRILAAKLEPCEPTFAQVLPDVSFCIVALLRRARAFFQNSSMRPIPFGEYSVI